MNYDVAAVAGELGISPEDLMWIVRKLLVDLSPAYAQGLKLPIESLDYPTIRTASHKFYGAAVNLHFETVAAILGDIEQSAAHEQKIDYDSLFRRLQAELAGLRNQLHMDEGDSA